MKLIPIFVVSCLNIAAAYSRAAPPRSPGPRDAYHEGRSTTVHVHSGQSIQHAINSAAPGTEIIVGPGTYAEQLLIKTDDLKLVGQGASLVPPSKAKSNTCSGVCGSGTQVGICVSGSGIQLAPFVTEHRKVISVKQPVQGISVSGFHVSGFSGANILVLGAEDAWIGSNTLVDGPTYGFLTAGSRSTAMQDNIVTSSDASAPGFIAMCMDNFNDAYASGNTISYYVVGLCIETDDAELQHNSVSYTCNAAYIDPDTKGVKLVNNQVSTSYDQCGGFGSYGIVLDGAQNSFVEGNLIEHQHNSGPAAGLVMIDDPCTEPSLTCPVVGKAAISSSNIVVGNVFKDNDLDLFVNTTGTHNVFKRNSCSSSDPKGLCKHG